VLMPRTSDLGRFRAYTQLAADNFTDGATYHSTANTTDLVLLTNPSMARLASFFYLPPSSGDPRNGSWQVQDSAILVGAGPYEIETADPDGDGHDDIAILRSTDIGTMVRKLRMGMSAGTLLVLETTTIELPAILRELRILDLNGDGRSDIVFHAPGFGVFAYTDDAAGSFTPFFDLRFTGMPLRDIVVGDIDADGRDDFALVFEIGVGMIRSTSSGIQFAGLFKPDHFSNLATAAILDAGDEAGLELVMLPADGQNLAIFPFDEVSESFTAPILESPWQTDRANYSGSGNPDLRVLAADLDNDGDQELLLPMPDGQHWLSLRGPVVDLSPLDSIVVEDLGRMGLSDFYKQVLTLSLPDAWFTAGIPELEVAVFLEHPDTFDTFYWTRAFPTVDPQTMTASFGLVININNQGVRNMLDANLTSIDGFMTAGGPTLISMHGKNGTRRFASRMLFFDGNGGGSGSEVGITWDVVAAPPQPERDADLLPWN